MSPDDPRHGTRAGYQQCRKNVAGACGPCKEAMRDYQRAWRGRTDREPERRRTRVRQRVLWRLVALHRDDYDRLYSEEIRKEFLGEAS